MRCRRGDEQIDRSRERRRKEDDVEQIDRSRERRRKEDDVERRRKGDVGDVVEEEEEEEESA